MTQTHNKRFFALLQSVPALLLIPAGAMLFTQEVNWTAGDFGMMASLLLLLILAIEGALRLIPKRHQRILLLAGVLLLFGLVWLELAVGIFGSSWAGS